MSNRGDEAVGTLWLQIITCKFENVFILGKMVLLLSGKAEKYTLKAS